MGDGGWYDFGSSSEGTGFIAESPDEWTVGFLIWLPGCDYGLNVQSYYLPSTVRDGENPNSRWTVIFVDEWVFWNSHWCQKCRFSILLSKQNSHKWRIDSTFWLTRGPFFIQYPIIPCIRCLVIVFTYENVIWYSIGKCLTGKIFVVMLTRTARRFDNGNMPGKFVWIRILHYSYPHGLHTPFL